MFRVTARVEFYVLLTVHLGSVLVNNEPDAQFFLLIYLFQFSNVSSTPVLIIRRINCINLLKTTRYVMHHQFFNIQQLYVLPTLYLCVLYLSENKQRLVPLTA